MKKMKVLALALVAMLTVNLSSQKADATSTWTAAVNACPAGVLCPLMVIAGGIMIFKEADLARFFNQPVEDFGDYNYKSQTQPWSTVKGSEDWEIAWPQVITQTQSGDSVLMTINNLCVGNKRTLLGVAQVPVRNSDLSETDNWNGETTKQVVKADLVSVKAYCMKESGCTLSEDAEGLVYETVDYGKPQTVYLYKTNSESDNGREEIQGKFTYRIKSCSSL